MDVRALGFELGQTPFEEGIRVGQRGIIVGSGDTFATSTPEIKCDLVDMEAYAIAKIAGIKLCQALNKQYNFNSICLMPTNLYGPGDNYNRMNSHVIPGLIRKFYV